MLITNYEFAEFYDKLLFAQAANEEICVDTETSGLNPWGTRGKGPDTMIGLPIGFGAGEFYLPVGHAYGANLDPEKVKAVLGILSQCRLLNHNLFGFDSYMLANMGMEFPRGGRDTMFLMQLLDENHSVGLKQCAKRYLGTGDEDAHDLDKLLMLWGLDKGQMWRLPASAVEPYACTDVRLPRELVRLLEPKLPGDLRAVWDVRNRAGYVVHRMVRDGIHINKSTLDRVRADAYRAMVGIEMELRKILGGRFNPNSPKQVTTRLGIPDSTDATLEKCQHPAAALIRRWRGYNKAITSYYDVYEERMDYMGLIHPNVRMTGTETGRWSSRDPNMQAVPQYDEEQRVKELLEARREDFEMYEWDFSQAELRVGAHYTRDEKLIDAIVSGKDIHQATADATGMSRADAKTINFAMVYGSGAHALAPQLRKTEKETHALLQAWHAAYPGFRETARKAENVARDKGFIKMYNGRRRHFNSPDVEFRNAFSYVVQGGVAQMVEETVIDVAEAIWDAGGMITNQIHDAYWAELPKGSEELARHIQKRMEDQPWCSVPMKVDTKRGPTLHKMEKVERNV